MAEAWYISDWQEHYEVNASGHPWQPGEKKRVGPLRFVRWHPYGPGGDNKRYEEAADAAADNFGHQAWATAFALFAKSVEIAARQTCHLRGYLLGRNHSPISVNRLCRITCFTEAQVTQGLAVLAHPAVGWLCRREIPPVTESTVPYISQYKATETETEKQTKTKQPKDNSEQPPPAADLVQPSSPEGGKGLSDSVSEKKQKELRGDTPSLSEKSGIVGGRDGIAYGIGLHLRLWADRAMKQGRADATSLRTCADHIMASHTGGPYDGKMAAYAKAKEIAEDRNVTKRMAVFLAWFKKELARHGNTWNKF